MNILEYIQKNKVFFAGATGTELIKLGMGAGELSSDWNISHPNEIATLHKAYVDVGVNAITTSTFTANGLNYPSKTELEHLIQKSFELARMAAKDSKEKVFVGLNIGPLGKLLEPLGTFKFSDAKVLFTQLAQLGNDNNADFILIETMNEFSEAKIALEAVKYAAKMPVFISFSFSKFGRLLNGETVEDCVKMAKALGADVVGANCSLGPDLLFEIGKRIKACSSLPVLIKPNAGLPIQRGDKLYYNVNAEEFSDTMKKLSDLGVECLGGCCGTNPDYIQKMIEKIKGN